MNWQLTIGDYLASLPPEARGETCQEIDNPRLNEQGLRVYRFMRDLRPHTLREIAAATGDSEASISARIREIRAYLEGRPKKGDTLDVQRPKLGTVKRERVEGGNGLHSYSMRLNRSFGAA